MSESEFDSPEADKQQFIEDTFSDGEDMRHQLNHILTSNNIDPNEIESSLHLDCGLGPEIVFARNSNIKNVTATESYYSDGDIPPFTEEDDPLKEIPIHEIHKGVLEKLSLGEKQKVQIFRDPAEDVLKILKASGQNFDLVTRLNIFPYKLKSRIEDIARQMLSVTNHGGIVVITTQEGDDTILTHLSEKLQNEPSVGQIFIQQVSTNPKESTMEALGSFAIIIQKK